MWDALARLFSVIASGPSNTAGLRSCELAIDPRGFAKPLQSIARPAQLHRSRDGGIECQCQVEKIRFAALGHQKQMKIRRLARIS